VDCIFNRTIVPLYYFTLSTGIGTWGLNKTVGWAWDITNFVWLVLVLEH
jgi:molybdopterin-containing oxidoreductase family membrane subunit